jgi:hypothetical protein
VKIKSVPISFHWPSKGDKGENPLMAGGRRQASNCAVLKGPTCQRPWFRPPQLVRIIPGILRRSLAVGIHVVHQEGGEREVRDEEESSYLHCPTRTHPPDSHLHPQSGGIPNPNPDPQPLHPNSSLTAKSNLAKFVRHLWSGAPTKSFMSVVRSEPAGIV